MNLLPFIGLDGGRLLAVLAPPVSKWNLIVPVVALLGLCAAAAQARTYPWILLALLGLLLLSRQLATIRLRAAVGRVLAQPAQADDVAAAAMTVMSEGRYAGWRSAVRQRQACLLAEQFACPPATGRERLWGGLLYLGASLLAVGIAALGLRPG
jgi:hypothetical protein